MLDEDGVGDCVEGSERSSRVSAAVSPLSMVMRILSMVDMRAVSVLWLALKPN